MMPNNKMDRFTQRARRVLSLAQAETEEMLHNLIGTEHLLLALLREEGGVAGRVLRDLGLEQRRVEQSIGEMPHTARAIDTPLDLSPRLKHVLELAVDEARRMGHHYMGTEHLLLALVREGGSTAVAILKRWGITPEQVRRQTRRVLQESPLVGSAPPSFAETPPQPARISPAKNSTLHLRVTDIQTGMVKLDFTLPVDEVAAILDTVYDLIDQGETSKVIVDDRHHAQRIEIHIDDNLQSLESGDSDV
jgi:ATP-dependent Clp protease ATP-binding subunit ClpA